METIFFPLLSVILISVLPELILFADAAPPTEWIVGIAIAALLGLGFFVVVIVVISIFVIRAIKKNRAPKDGA
ncbi:MAG: hypothetical protein JXA21_17240 [Anaerolineae bacterium]|nr:hypothetical protein [Anaerolineae bacterium]